MKIIAVNLLMLCMAVLAQQSSQKETPSEQCVGSSEQCVGLIELEATTHIVEGPIREGGYDDTFGIRRARYLVPDLLDCSDRIAGVAKQWADTQGAKIVTTSRGPHRVLIHLEKPNVPGFYELLYRVDLDKGTGVITFFRYRRGIRITPDTEPQSGVDKLVPMLKEALTCVQPSSSSSH
jgi:hypothetical protein